jgi:hypothetical protein
MGLQIRENRARLGLIEFASTCRRAWQGWDGIEAIGQPVKGDRDPAAHCSVRLCGGYLPVTRYMVGSPQDQPQTTNQWRGTG